MEKRHLFGQAWYKFSRSKASVVGAVLVLLVIGLALLAPFVSPYPKQAGPYVDFDNASQPPSTAHLLGTDNMGRDILSRLIFALRPGLLMGILVLAISVPIGFGLGLIAGYNRGSLLDSLIMRITDIFLSVPPLILALAIASVLEPNLTHAMMAITVMWWPWYCRLAYNVASSIRNDYYVRYAELTGASTFHILVREILPNCVSPVLTKMTLDMGWVIMTAASLSFVGLGQQPPAPDLGNMVSDGVKYLPDFWWMTIFPAITIVLLVLGFNLLGDGIRDLFTVEEA